MTERKPSDMSFETWVDHQISSAQERGAFDDLPGAGKPLPRPPAGDSSYAWAVAWARREGADPRDMLPPALALRREWQDLPQTIAQLPSAGAVRAVLEDYNDRVRLMWRRPQEGPIVPTPLVDVDERVAEWERARPPAPPPAPPVTPVRRRWWRRRGQR